MNMIQDKLNKQSYKSEILKLNGGLGSSNTADKCRLMAFMHLIRKHTDSRPIYLNNCTKARNILQGTCLQ